MSHSSTIRGVKFYPIQKHEDDRGELSEIFRNQWIDNDHPIQWNYVKSNPNVLRGFHVHYLHTDYLMLMEGKMELALKDLRTESPSSFQSEIVNISGKERYLIKIPPGVGHGFYFPIPSIHIYSVSQYWNTKDELGCLWNDPDLNMSWPTSYEKSPLLSKKDKKAQSYLSFLEQFNNAWKNDR